MVLRIPLESDFVGRWILEPLHGPDGAPLAGAVEYGEVEYGEVVYALTAEQWGAR